MLSLLAETIRMSDPRLHQALHRSQLPTQTCQDPLGQRATGAQKGRTPSTRKDRDRELTTNRKRRCLPLQSCQVISNLLNFCLLLMAEREESDLKV